MTRCAISCNKQLQRVAGGISQRAFAAVSSFMAWGYAMVDRLELSPPSAGDGDWYAPAHAGVRGSRIYD